MATEKTSAVDNSKMVRFPSIYDFHRVGRVVRERAAYRGRDAEGKAIYDPAPEIPILHYRGSVKIHGTNGGIVLTPSGIHAQSRDNVVTVERDHFGLAAHLVEHQHEIRHLFALVAQILGLGPYHQRTIAFLGEWAGDKIQTKASIAVLPKFFTIAFVNVDGVWHDMRQFRSLHSKDARIFNTEMFDTYEISVDFTRQDLMQNQLAALTDKVEKDCPVARYFGIKGIGEGLVWNCTNDPDPELWMKVKGQEHSNTNVKLINTVNHDEVSRHYNFVDAVVQLPRLEQALHVMVHEKHLEFNQVNMSEFIRWIFADVTREEAILMEEKNIDPKKIGRPISEICKRWYMEKLLNNKTQTSITEVIPGLLAKLLEAKN